jgi:hypothetical protein
MGWANQISTALTQDPAAGACPTYTPSSDALPANKAIFQDALGAAGNTPLV